MSVSRSPPFSPDQVVMIFNRHAIRAILITPENELLLLRIRAPGTTEWFWIAPGGGLEPDKTPEEGLRRELREELGLEHFKMGPAVWRRQHTFNWDGRRICQRELYHVIHVDRFEPHMSDPVEIKVLGEFRWWPISDLAQARERLTPLSLAEIVERYLTHGTPSELPEWEVLVD